MASSPTTIPISPPRNAPPSPPSNAPTALLNTTASIVSIMPPKMPARKPANAPLPAPPRAMSPAMSPPIKCPIIGRMNPSTAIMMKPTNAPSQRFPLLPVFFHLCGCGMLWFGFE
jgi:hypothetical protein